MKVKLMILAAACSLLCGCHTNSSGWPIIWGMHNGTPVQKAPKPADLLKKLKARDTKIMDLAELGKSLVAQYGSGQAELLVLETWTELTNQPFDKAKDMIWLVDQSPRVRDVAWLVQFRDEWLTH